MLVPNDMQTTLIVNIPTSTSSGTLLDNMGTRKFSNKIAFDQSNCFIIIIFLPRERRTEVALF